MPSFGRFPGVCVLCADVWEHSVCSIFICGVSRKNAYTVYEDGTVCSETSTHKIQTLAPANHPKERIQQSVVLLPDLTLSVTRTDTILPKRFVIHNDPTDYE